ncbi:MAG: SCO family protein [Pyrinomonadaceae bacterium]
MRIKLFITLIFSTLILNACQGAKTQTASGDAKRYTLKGEVVSVDPANKKASIKHDEIPGFMESMTMDFPIKEDWVWEDLKPGAEIRADLVVDNANGAFWLEKIAIVAAPNPNRPAPEPDPRFAQIGKEIPDFSLVNQDGKKISAKDFRGKALAITFIYSRCPLPNYCILMSKNFSDAAVDLMKNEDLKDKIRLLSISFDPETDTPQKLRQYGLGYLGKNADGDFSVWQLATGSDKEIKGIADFFGLRYEVDPNDKTQFNHSLRTMVISPEGKIEKIFPGNDWTPGQLIGELKKTLK